MSSPPKPDHSTNGQTLTNAHNTWTKETKAKTAKCLLCGKLVKVFCWQCNRCKVRICADCCDDDPSGADYNRQSAKDMLENGCWCRFPSKINPALTKLKSGPPPKHEDQYQKDASAKKKAMETSAKKKAAREGLLAADASPSAQAAARRRDVVDYSRSSTKPTQLDDSDKEILEGEAGPSRRRGSMRRGSRGDSTDEDAAGSDVSPGLRSTGASSSRRRREVADVVEGEEGGEGAQASPSKEQATRQRPGSSAARGKQAASGRFDRKHQKSGERKGGEAGLTTTAAEAKLSGPLHYGHTVIIGAGIIGLFTAFELASRCVADKIPHDITVVEIRGDVGELATLFCNGLLTHHDIPKQGEWELLLASAKAGWEEIRKDADEEEIGYTKHRMYFAEDVESGESDDDGIVVPWFKPKAIYRLNRGKKGDRARVNTPDTAVWLRECCEEMGVKFIFNRVVEEVEHRPDGKLRVQIGHPLRPFADDLSKFFTATDLVIAAGPFTTHIATHLLNNGEKPGLGNRWTTYTFVDVPVSKEEGFDAAISAHVRDEWTNGTLNMVAYPDGDVRFAAVAGKTSTAHLDPVWYARNNHDTDTKQLEQLAAQHLGLKSTDELQAAGNGGALISTAHNREPYVGQLEMRSDGNEELVAMPHVWLSYGFGQFGTAVAPGAAKKLVGLMLAQN